MSHAPSTTHLRTLGLLTTLACLAPAFAQAQATDAAPARVQGVVVHEATFQPIADAVVTLVGTDVETRTGSLGQFAIADAPLGTTWVRVTVAGLPSVREQVEVTADGVVFLQFRMPEDVSAVLQEVMVDVWDPDAASAEAVTAMDLLAMKIPSVSLRSPGDVGDNNQAVRLRGFSSITQNGNPLIVIDDVAQTGDSPLTLLDHIPASDVESIEVLRGPVAAFRYPFAANGVIHVRTKKN